MPVPAKLVDEYVEVHCSMYIWKGHDKKQRPSAFQADLSYYFKAYP